MWMQDEVLSTVGAKDIDSSGYQMSDLDDIEFHWDDPVLDMDAVFLPGKDTLFSHSMYTNFQMGSMSENTILIDEEKDKGNSPPPLPTTPVAERPTQPPVLI